MEVPGAVTDYTAHMYSIQAKYFAGDKKETSGSITSPLHPLHFPHALS